MLFARSRFWVMLMSSCALACGGRATAGVVAQATLTAWIQGSGFPSGVGFNLVDPPLETFGGAAGSGNHIESWSPATAITGTPGNAVTGFAQANGYTHSMNPLGESHMSSFANSKGLKFTNFNAAAVTINLVVQWEYDLQVMIEDPNVDSGDAGYYFRIRNVTAGTTLQEHDLIIAGGSESVGYGAPLELVLPAQSSTTIRVEGQAWADAYTVPAPPPVALAMVVGVVRLGSRRRTPQAR